MLYSVLFLSKKLTFHESFNYLIICSCGVKAKEPHIWFNLLKQIKLLRNVIYILIKPDISQWNGWRSQYFITQGRSITHTVFWFIQFHIRHLQQCHLRTHFRIWLFGQPFPESSKQISWLLSHITFEWIWICMNGSQESRVGGNKEKAPTLTTLLPQTRHIRLVSDVTC